MIMNISELHQSLNRIKGLADALVTSDGSIPIVGTKVTVLLDLCEQLLLEAQKEKSDSEDRTSD